VRDFLDPRDYTVKHDVVKAFQIPSKAFGDEEGKEIPGQFDINDTIDLPAIKNQGSVGSCTGHAGTYMYEVFTRLLAYEGVCAPMTFSAGFLYKVTRNLLGWKEDRGAYLRTTMQALSMFGVPEERFWPYNVHKFNRQPSAFLYAIAQNYQALVYYRLDAKGLLPRSIVDSIKLNLASNRACIFGFTTFTNLERCRDGKIEMPGRFDRPKGGHAICAVGYADSYKIGDSVGAFRIANSWGTKWGEDGFGWLPYDFVLKGFATDWWTMHKMEWIDVSIFK